MAALAARLRDVRFLRYFAASVCALAVDLGTFFALLSLGVAAAASSALGYAFGILVHWLLSSRAVFIGLLAEPGNRRTRQKALFVGSALIGLSLTTVIVGGGDAAGFDPRLAKLVAIGVSFFSVWLMRSQIVFHPRSVR